MTDASHYQSNLAGEQVAISESAPAVGYYKMRKHRGAPWSPVCIFMHEGELVARVGPDMADPATIWTWCAGNPVAKAEALHAFQHGSWPGDAPPPISHNNPPSDDPFDALTREVEAEAARVRAWIAEPREGKIAADQAANWLDSLRKVEKRVIAGFDAEKAPALAESNRIDVKWRGLKVLADQIKRAMSTRYDEIARKERQRLQAIADAKAREEAEKRRAEQEAERVKMEALAQEHGVHLEPQPLPEPVVLAAPPVKVAFGGAQGNKIAPKKTPPTAVVEDWAKAAAHYAGNAKLRELVQKLANNDARNGVAAPGVKIIPGE